MTQLSNNQTKQTAGILENIRSLTEVLSPLVKGGVICEEELSTSVRASLLRGMRPVVVLVEILGGAKIRSSMLSKKEMSAIKKATLNAESILVDEKERLVLQRLAPMPA